MKEKNLIRLEKQIRIKMNGIRSGTITPKESGIGSMINLLRTFDEPLYESIIKEYKDILINLN